MNFLPFDNFSGPKSIDFFFKKRIFDQSKNNLNKISFRCSHSEKIRKSIKIFVPYN